MTYIKIFKDIVGAVGLLSDEEAGRLFKGLLCYANGNETDLPGQEKLIFAMLKIQLDRDKAAYGSYIEKQRANGAKGGRPRKTQNPPVKKKADMDNTVSENRCGDIKDGTLAINNKADTDSIPAQERNAETVAEGPAVLAQNAPAQENEAQETAPMGENKAPETAPQGENGTPGSDAAPDPAAKAFERIQNAWNTLPEAIPKVQNIVPGTDRYRKLQHCIRTLGRSRSLTP